MEGTRWLELFQRFTAVQGLYVSKKLGPLVAHALQGLTGERAKEVLPALRRLSLGGFKPSGSAQEVIEPFVSARQLSDYPVTVERWERNLYWDSDDDDL
jgi:hypothetical protein